MGKIAIIRHALPATSKFGSEGMSPLYEEITGLKAPESMPDEQLYLGGQGFVMARFVGNSLAEQGFTPATLLTSPYVRTQQTGAAVLETLGVEGIPHTIVNGMSPGSDTPPLHKAIKEVKADQALVVLHDCHPGQFLQEAVYGGTYPPHPEYTSKHQLVLDSMNPYDVPNTSGYLLEFAGPVADVYKHTGNAANFSITPLAPHLTMAQTLMSLGNAIEATNPRHSVPQDTALALYYLAAQFEALEGEQKLIRAMYKSPNPLMEKEPLILHLLSAADYITQVTSLSPEVQARNGIPPKAAVVCQQLVDAGVPQMIREYTDTKGIGVQDVQRAILSAERARDS
jgi:phosphohistidine phosphatase SixA